MCPETDRVLRGGGVTEGGRGEKSSGNFPERNSAGMWRNRQAFVVLPGLFGAEEVLLQGFSRRFVAGVELQGTLKSRHRLRFLAGSEVGHP